MFAFIKKHFLAHCTHTLTWTHEDELKMTGWKSAYYRFDRFL